MQHLGHNCNATVVIVAITVETAFALVITLAVCKLIILHIYLRCKGLTTYEHILAKRQRRKERVRFRQKLQKISAISDVQPQTDFWSMELAKTEARPSPTPSKPENLRSEVNNTLECADNQAEMYTKSAASSRSQHPLQS